MYFHPTQKTFNLRNSTLIPPPNNLSQGVVALDKAASSAYEAVDKIADATNQTAEALGKKGEQLKNVDF